MKKKGQLSPLVKTIIVGAVLYAFTWLAVTSWHRYQPYDVDGLNALSGTVTRAAHAQQPSLQRRQASALADIYGITAEEAAKPVILWRTK